MTAGQIAFVGEAWGEEEERRREPFVGKSGRLFNGMLSQVGIRREDCLVTNVFNLRPRPTNDIKNLCGPRDGGIEGMPYLQKSKYVKAEYAGELERLYAELIEYNPNVIVALGATAAWALLKTTGITKIRGAVAPGCTGHKVLPTYHPAGVARNWGWRPITIMDLAKAKREADFPEIRKPNRYIWVEPTLEDLYKYEHEHIRKSQEISWDIETIPQFQSITCIGFAPSEDSALVVPFYDPRQEDGNYWRTARDEGLAWRWVRRILKLEKAFCGQNLAYDIGFSWSAMGFINPSFADDTMLMHHAMQPELPKALDFLGSIYTDEAQWKFMRDKYTKTKRED